MGFPARMQFACSDPIIEQGVLWDSDLWTDTTASGGTAPTIGDSLLGDGRKALVIGNVPTSGSPNTNRQIRLPNVQRLVVEFEVILDYPATEFRFLNFLRVFGVVTAGSNTVLEMGQEDPSNASIVSATKHDADAWSLGGWSAHHVQPGVPTRIKIDITASSTNDNLGPRDGTIDTYVWVDDAWVLVKQGTHRRGPLRDIHFMQRPTLDIQAAQAVVEFRKIRIQFDGSDEDWSDLQACAQLRGGKFSATPGKRDQAVLLTYDPRLYGDPSGTLHAEVQASTDPTFATGVVYASIALQSADDYTSLTLANNPDLNGVAVLRALDPLTSYHWRVRFIDGGTLGESDEAITGGAEILLTDSASFKTASAPGSARGVITIGHGGCVRQSSAHTPHGVHEEFTARDVTMVIEPDDHYYETAHNDLPASNGQTAGAVRSDHYWTRARASLICNDVYARMAGGRAILGTVGNHIVDSAFPGNSTPTNASLASDALHAWRQFFDDGQLLEDRPEGKWGYDDTAAARIFLVNACAYDHEDASTHGPEGRQLQGSSDYTFPRLLGATQMAALLTAIEECDKPLFILSGMPPFASDAESPSSALVGWALAPLQRQAVIDAINANDAIRVMLPLSAHVHFSCITKQGYQDEAKILPNCMGGPVGQTIGGNYDTAFLADFDGGFLFKSDDGAGEGNAAAMGLIVEYDEDKLVGDGVGAITVTVIDGEGNDLVVQSFDAPPVNDTLQPLGGSISLNPHPRGTGRLRDKGFTVPGDPQPHPRGSGKPRPWSARD